MQQNEAVTYLHSVWVKNTEAKNIPTEIRNVFKKIQELFDRAYEKVTGKKLGDRLDKAYRAFYEKCTPKNWEEKCIRKYVRDSFTKTAI